MDSYIPKEKLTAYQRWELAAFDEAAAAPVEAPPPPEPPPVELPPEPEPIPVEPEEVIPLPTAEDIERIHTEAHAAGYAAGYEEGAAQARNEVERLAQVMGSLESAMQGLNQEVADQLLALGLEIAHQVTRTSLKIKPELLLPLVREALAALPVSQGHPSLFLHPEDAALVRNRMGDLITHGGWRVLEDSEMERGGCRIQAGASDVDATVATRWKRVLAAIGTQHDWLEP